MEAPNPPSTVEPFPPAINSRPVPVFGYGAGVSRIGDSVPFKRDEISNTLSRHHSSQTTERTSNSMMEAPEPPDTVELCRSTSSACSSLPSRSVPVFGIGEGAIQLAHSGKYDLFRASSNPEFHPVCSTIPSHRTTATPTPVCHSDGSHLRIIHPHSSPGRVPSTSTMEAPSSLNAVVPLQPAYNSRPGPVFEMDDGVFQTPIEGKYNQPWTSTLPDNFSDSSVAATLSTPGQLCLVDENNATLTTRNDSNVLAEQLSSNANEPTAYNHGSDICERTSLSRRRPKPASRNRQLEPSSSNRASVSPSTDDVFTVYYQNVGGLNSCCDDYLTASSDCCYDILALTETWLNQNTISSQVLDRQYEVFRCDRGPLNSNKVRGGGVLLAVRRGIKVQLIEDDAWTAVEQLWLAIELLDRTLYLCVVYFPPDRTRDESLIEAHTNSVTTIVDKASLTDDILIIGDFNLPGICWQSSSNGLLYPDATHSTLHRCTTRILDSYSTATLQQINHVVNENNRSLDLCFVSSCDNAPSITLAPAPLVKFVPHHPPLHLNIERRSVKLDTVNPSPVIYDFRNADYHSIILLLETLDWENILDGTNVNLAAETFCHILSYAIDRHVPKKTVAVGRTPWLTPELRRLKRQKRAALRRYSKYKSVSLRDHYVRLNIIYKRVSKRCYIRYQTGLQRRLKSHPQSFWDYVKQQRNECDLPSSMKWNGTVASEPQAICDLFASKFSSIFSNELLSDRQISSASSNTQPSGLAMPEVTVNNDAIMAAARKLKVSTCLGPNGIPSVFLKNCIESLLEPLQVIFSLSLSSGVFPSCWKRAYMFPVHKNGDRKNVDNYRGISSLCAVSKLFELVVMDQLFFHCKQFLSPDQHGFIPGRSTASNLLCLTSYVTDSMLERAQTDVLYLDLSAAFDKVNHQIAVAKLGKLGVHGTLLDWFQSYLNGRHSQVVIGESTSASFPITSGIPQGSHLGPLIFLLYFNDVNAVLDGPRLSFADDFKLYFKIRSEADAQFLQKQLDAFAHWCQMNRMTVNPAKCSVITFSRLKDPQLHDYSFSGVPLVRVNEIKDLGIILDSQLTFKQHVSFVVNKASKSLGFIFRITKEFTDIYCLKALYCALVRSTLEYCSTVWSPHYQNGIERIESVQRRFVRFALRRLPWRDPFRLPNYEHRCQLIHLDTLSTRRDVAKAMLVSDVLLGRVDCPEILQQINLYVRPRSLRNNAMLRPQPHRTNYGMNSAITGIQRVFNRVASQFDFNVSRDLLRARFLNVFR